MSEPQGSRPLPGILAAIVETKRAELAFLEAARAQVERAASDAGPVRDFAAALRAGPTVSVIAECKRRSPGAGEIRPGLDPASLASSYETAGARALSVLTDATYFGGTMADLRQARAATALPTLRKDFTIHPLHVVEARAAGADAVLLIVRILGDPLLGELLALSRDLGLGVLVEAHDEEEVARALHHGADVVGINNRDLATFTTSLETTLRLIERIPPEVTVVSESGIRTPDDVRMLAEAGAHAILVGETLLRSPDPGAAAAGLAAVPRDAGPRA